MARVAAREQLLSSSVAPTQDCDSVCSTLSDCSLIDCGRNFHRRPHGRSRQLQRPSNSPPLPPPPPPARASPTSLRSPSPSLPPPPSDCCENFDDSVADFHLGQAGGADQNFLLKNEGEGDALSSSSGGSSLSELSEDRATFRSTVVRQFEADLDKLEQAVAQRVGGGDAGSQAAPPAADGSVYSVVKSGCLRLLLSRVLPPILERFEQRLMGGLMSAGLLTAEQPQLTSSRTRTPESSCKQQRLVGSVQTSQRPLTAQKQPPQPAPKPAPRLLRKPSAVELQAHPRTPSSLQPPPPPPPPRTPSAPLLHLHQQQLHQPCGLQQQRVSSPYFLTQTTHRQFQQAPLTVRNNSSLVKASSPPPPPPKPAPKPPPALIAAEPAKPAAAGGHPRQQPLRSRSTTAVTSAATASAATAATTSVTTASAAAACHLVHAFTVRDSPSLRDILSDPGDRKVKSISQRYGCYIGVFQRARRPGHVPLHRVVVRAPGEKALRMCLHALDNGLGWDLGSQLGRKNSGASNGTALSSSTSK
ncbi:hypothetical protein BOX15_Mlig008300g1 [Macrostomum lignano]|uniref:Uncharacterized protein n=1 Tax=Macrostomum lignano TaxID=282301 RepID=A0A267EXP5_9PLAT|nr:hypothetical protein BOX15_Mlig008300g1 [Macrostomum lignano]